MHTDCLKPAAQLSASPTGEPMLTVDELARQFRVSTKTVHRWRQHGLVGRRSLPAGRGRVGFSQSSVDRFVANNEKRVRRGTQFSRLTDEERNRQIDNDVDGAQIMDLPLDYIGNEQFARVYSEKRERGILKAMPENDPLARPPRVPSDLPAYLAGLYEVPLLTREQEVHLFRKMNYLKYKASLLRAQLDPNRPASRLLGQIERLYDQSIATKNQIVLANLRLVVSIAKRYVGSTQDFFELVSDGNMSLLKAVDKFDYSLGNRFSTYATWAIMKNFARTLHSAARHRDHFRTSHAEIFSYTEDVSQDPHEQESAQIKRESLVERILDRLDERERQIITARFGLIRGHEPLTLAQIGVTLGVTKERVRQIQARAISKLKAAAEESGSECITTLLPSRR